MPSSICLLLACFLAAVDGCMQVSPGTPGMPAMNCKTCAGNLIEITMTGDGAHEMASDITDMSGTCNMRTFTCNGPFANIEINRGEGVANDGDDGAVDEVARFTVTCNAAGTAWLNSGIVITQVECASGM